MKTIRGTGSRKINQIIDCELRKMFGGRDIFASYDPEIGDFFYISPGIPKAEMKELRRLMAGAKKQKRR